jgi:type I restriction enzyme S subunit
MDMKPGYKQTELGVIPVDWNLMKLKQIVEDNRIPSGIYKDKSLYGQGRKIIKLGDVFGYDYFVPDLAQRVELSLEEATNYRVEVGDIIIALASVKLEGVGKVMLVASLDEETAYDHNVALIRLIEEVDQKYIFYLFKSDAVRKLVGSYATQVGTTFLKTSTILEFALALPPLAEQRAIAATFSDVDALIAGLDRLIAKKRDIKQAAMQELLNGKKRLSGFKDGNGYKKTDAGLLPRDWDAIKLGDLFIFKNGLNKGKEHFGYGIPIVNYMDVYKKSGIYAADIKGRVDLKKQEIKAYDVRKGDVFFTRTSETTDEIGITSVMLDDPKDTVFSGFVLRARPKNDILDDQFKRYCFSTISVRKAIISKSSYTTRALTNGHLLSIIVIPLPSIHEQRAIASVLSDMDAEIAALEARREKTRALKQGMMQELLTGRIRLV